jgi:RimJ/RimL family protein N-acetyltransferase
LIVYDSPEITEWTANQLFNQGMEYFGPATSIGQVMGGKIISGLVYNNYKETPEGKPLLIEMSIATTCKSWANKRYLYTIFAYPFIQLGLERVQITTSVVNEGVNRLVSKLGYIKEGTHRKAYVDGGDAYSWSMLKQECRWI